MPLTIADVYAQAAKSGNWGFALRSTGVLRDDGKLAKPEDDAELAELIRKLDHLREYTGADPRVAEVVAELDSYLSKE
ncbi:MAG: hypothetical protein AB2652_04835 [Candidatus Thiodiazotropha endolucinida]